PPRRPTRDAWRRGIGARIGPARGRTRRACTLPDPCRRSRLPPVDPDGATAVNPGDTFDARQVRRAFSRAAPGYEAAAALQREVEAQLLESLEFHAARHGDDTVPQRVLDLGSG